MVQYTSPGEATHNMLPIPQHKPVQRTLLMAQQIHLEGVAAG